MTLIIEPVTEIISLITGKNRGRFPWSNSFLIQGSETVLIDTGCGIENLQALKQQYSIDYVINSHCHPDHSAGNWVFAGLPLHVPLESADSHGRMESLSHRLTESGKLAEIWKKFVVKEMNFQDSFPTRFYQDGDEFDLGDIRLRAIHTPGHTADHYCFFEPEEAEGGARLMVGPTFRVRLSEKMHLRLGGGPIFYMTQNTPTSKAPRLLPSGDSGYAIRFSMIYGI